MPGFNPPMFVRRSKSKLGPWVPVVIWMLLIFFASSDAESGYRGSRLIGPVIRFLVPGISQPALEDAVLLVRKGVHFATFAVLATLAFRALAATCRQRLPTEPRPPNVGGEGRLPSTLGPREGSLGDQDAAIPGRLRWVAWRAWGFSVLYAVSDEIHQTWVPNRVGSATDVLIDSVGAAFATLLSYAWMLRGARRERERERERGRTDEVPHGGSGGVLRGGDRDRAVG